MDPQHLKLYGDAAGFAAMMHYGQPRSGTGDPYIVHPMRVAELATKFKLGIYSIIAALLHDVVEDTPATLDDLRDRFPAEVVDMVSRLTKSWTPDDPDVAGCKAAYYAGILGCPDAISLKMLDRIDNLQDMRRVLPRSENWARKYLRKTREEFVEMYAACTNEQVKALFDETLESLEQKLSFYEQRRQAGLSTFTSQHQSAVPGDNGGVSKGH